MPQRIHSDCATMTISSSTLTAATDINTCQCLTSHQADCSDICQCTCILSLSTLSHKGSKNRQLAGSPPTNQPTTTFQEVCGGTAGDKSKHTVTWGPALEAIAVKICTLLTKTRSYLVVCKSKIEHSEHLQSEQLNPVTLDINVPAVW